MIHAQFHQAYFVDAMEETLNQVYAAVERRINVLNTQLQQHIQRDKLSGQVLHQRSGKLKRSVEVIQAVVNRAAGTITGGVQAGGGPAFYGKFHEFGTTRTYTIRPVNKQALRFMMQNRVVYAKRVTHPPLPERSFMRTGQADMRQDFIDGVQQAIENVYRSGPHS